MAMSHVRISGQPPANMKFEHTPGAILDRMLILVLLIFRIPPGFLGRRARCARLSGLLASSFTFDSHERHKSLFLAKSRKSKYKYGNLGFYIIYSNTGNSSSFLSAELA